MARLFGKPRAATPGDVYRVLLYGHATRAEWESRERRSIEPWRSFDRGFDLLDAGNVGAATATWRELAEDERLESRHRLQAWCFLRSIGVVPPADDAREVLGAVIEVPVGKAHDLVAAYRDGSMQYVNTAGRVVDWDDPFADTTLNAISDWLRVAARLADEAEPLDDGPLPALPTGALRLAALTPDGLRLRQGPDAVLRREPAAAFQEAAAQLMRMIAKT